MTNNKDVKAWKEKVTIHLSDKYYGDKTILIEAINASRENKYIHSVILNSKKVKFQEILSKRIEEGW